MERAATLSNADLVYNVYPTESAQGNPATFDDGADNIPVKDLKVSIVPNQDLHGYDKPWPAGGGKNLLPMTVAGIKAANTAGTWNGNIFTHSSGMTVTILTDSDNNVVGLDFNGTTSNSEMNFVIERNVSIPNGQYIYNTPTASGQAGMWLSTTNPSLAIVLENNTSGNITVSGGTIDRGYVYFNQSITLNHYIIRPMLRLSTVSDATFAPYSNECPITGMTEVEVERTGKNLFGLGFNVVDKTSEWRALPNQRLTMQVLDSNKAKFTALGNWSVAYLLIEGLDGTRAYSFSYDILSNDTGYTPHVEKDTALSNENRLVISVFLTNLDWLNSKSFTLDNIQVTLGSASTAYEPFEGQEFSIPLGRTVYGGTLDVTTGVLIVDRASVDLGTLTWVKFDGSDYGTMYYTDSLIGSIAYADWDKIYGISSAYKGYPNHYNQPIGSEWSMPDGGFRVRNTDGRVYVRDENATTLSAFTTRINGVQLVYELKTPQTYTLTPQELLSVLGTNHISTDAESVEVVYRQDIGLILKRMSDSLLPYLPLTRDGIYDLKAEVTGGEKFLYWWTQAFSMMSSARPMQTPIADEPVDELEEVEEMTPEEDEED
jgi:hypothetical protein